MDRDILLFKLKNKIDIQYISHFGFTSKDEYLKIAHSELLASSVWCKSILVIGITLDKSVIKKLPETRIAYTENFHRVNKLLNQSSKQIAAYFMDRGNMALALPATTATLSDAKSGTADISHRLAAYVAGLGSFGLNNLFLVPYDFAAVRWNSILLDVEVDDSKKSPPTVCDNCGRCLEICPAKALSKNKQAPKIDKNKCFEYMTNDLGGLRCGMCIAACLQSEKVEKRLCKLCK